MAEISSGNLYWLYVKIGSLSFGGGLVLVPYLIEELSTKRKLASPADLQKMVTVCRFFPGVFSISCAVYSGYLLKKTKGRLLGLLGIITPSLFCITSFFLLFNLIKDQPALGYFLQGVKLSVFFLLLKAAWNLFKVDQYRVFHVLIILGIGLAMALLNVSTLVIILFVLSYLLGQISREVPYGF
jgi:chromate transporter